MVGGDCRLLADTLEYVRGVRSAGHDCYEFRLCCIHVPWLGRREHSIEENFTGAVTRVVLLRLREVIP